MNSLTIPKRVTQRIGQGDGFFVGSNDFFESQEVCQVVSFPYLTRSFLVGLPDTSPLRACVQAIGPLGDSPGNAEIFFFEHLSSETYGFPGNQKSILRPHQLRWGKYPWLCTPPVFFSPSQVVGDFGDFWWKLRGLQLGHFFLTPATRMATIGWK